jgi:adenosine deaminase
MAPPPIQISDLRFSQVDKEGDNREDPADFVHKLTKYVSDARICLEVCPTSNLGTMPGLQIKDHPVGRMVREGVCVTINTDNRLVSQTTTMAELRKVVDTFDLTPKQLKEIVTNGIKRSFFHGSYPQKRRYQRAYMDFYDAVAEKHNIMERYANYKKTSSQGSEIDS